jgi:hypothetical protein
MDFKKIFVAMIPVALGVTVGVVAANRIEAALAAKA